jgi:hypothetical protein
VLLPGEPDEDPEAVAERQVEQPPGRDRIDAQGVDAMGGHRREIALDRHRVVAFGAVGSGAERAVGHAADEELLALDVQELSIRARPGGSPRMLRLRHTVNRSGALSKQSDTASGRLKPLRNSCQLGAGPRPVPALRRISRHLNWISRHFEDIYRRSNVIPRGRLAVWRGRKRPYGRRGEKALTPPESSPRTSAC